MVQTHTSQNMHLFTQVHDLIGDASARVNGNNINLTYTPDSGTATVKVTATYIDV